MPHLFIVTNDADTVYDNGNGLFVSGAHDPASDVAEFGTVEAARRAIAALSLSHAWPGFYVKACECEIDVTDD